MCGAGSTPPALTDCTPCWRDECKGTLSLSVAGAHLSCLTTIKNASASSHSSTAKPSEHSSSQQVIGSFVKRCVQRHVCNGELLEGWTFLCVFFVFVLFSGIAIRSHDGRSSMAHIFSTSSLLLLLFFFCSDGWGTDRTWSRCGVCGYNICIIIRILLYTFILLRLADT